MKRAKAVTAKTPSDLIRIAQPAQWDMSVGERSSKVAVPMGGPSTISEVSTTYRPFETVTLKRSIPRGAGPSRFSPRIVYLLPWHRHSNHLLASHSCGIWQPRCGHLRYRARTDRSTGGISVETW